MSLIPTQASSFGAPTENLAGLVERVTFHNEENGFCVLRLKARGQRDLVTVIGHAAMISAGEWIQAAGTWTNDRTHGLQFRAAFLKAIIYIANQSQKRCHIAVQVMSLGASLNAGLGSPALKGAFCIISYIW